MKYPRHFKCSLCHKEIDWLTSYYLPGQQIFDSISGITYNTGQNYCKECYEELTKKDERQTEKAKLVKEPSKQLHISDLVKRKFKINIIVKIADFKKTKFIQKDKKELKLSEFIVEDKTGKISLILWNNRLYFNKGDYIKIENGFVREFDKSIKLTLGKDGVLNRLD